MHKCIGVPRSLPKLATRSIYIPPNKSSCDPRGGHTSRTWDTFGASSTIISQWLKLAAIVCQTSDAHNGYVIEHVWCVCECVLELKDMISMLFEFLILCGSSASTRHDHRALMLLEC